MLQIGPITFTFQDILDASAISPWLGMWVLFLKGGWIPMVFAMLWGLKKYWIFRIENRFAGAWEWVLLSIDIPAENIQSPRAVENILAHLAGAHNTPDLAELYIHGWVQEWFSLEIVSINGHIRFFVYTPVKVRDLVESAIYAQYPGAEIEEADDYTTDVPSHYPDKEYDVFGTEFVLVNKQAYPIRTYEEFQDEISEEAKFKDPMAAMLETMSSLRDGEQLWFQVLIQPIVHRSWQASSHREVARLAGITAHEKETWLQKLIGLPSDILVLIVDLLMPGTPASDRRAAQEMPSQMLYLTPGAREAIEAIERKASKIGFNSKVRFVYAAKKDVFYKPRAVYGMIGAMKQMTDEDLNAFKPDFKRVGTHTKYWLKAMRKDWRKTKVVIAYKKRSMSRGLLKFILNIEEIATIWHFPIAESVKTPSLRKAESKRAEPPMELPMEFPSAFQKKKRSDNAKAAPPVELPVESIEEAEEEEDWENPPGNLPVR